MARGCSYRQFWDGTQCTACLDGFYGKHCTKKCEDGAYGQQCGNTCQCPIEQCNHVSGCITDDKPSSKLYDGTSGTPSLPSNIMNTSNVIITSENAYSTTSQNFECPVNLIRRRTSIKQYIWTGMRPMKINNIEHITNLSIQCQMNQIGTEKTMHVTRKLMKLKIVEQL
ncbi:uncharacterized protein LOC111105362 isoform X3 [Crassostrea virginica]